MTVPPPLSLFLWFWDQNVSGVPEASGHCHGDVPAVQRRPRVGRPHGGRRVPEQNHQSEDPAPNLRVRTLLFNLLCVSHSDRELVFLYLFLFTL